MLKMYVVIYYYLDFLKINTYRGAINKEGSRACHNTQHITLTSCVLVHSKARDHMNSNINLPLFGHRMCGLNSISCLWSQELAAEGVLVVSGHHADLHLEKNRLIIDESGGLDLPIAAIILPSREIVRDTDDFAATMATVPPQPVLAAH
jgi:hypothetical protein